MEKHIISLSGAVTDTTVSSSIHRIFNGNDEIRFVTNIKSESECNSSTTDSSNTILQIIRLWFRQFIIWYR